jgi:Nif-specific regulatory protein
MLTSFSEFKYFQEIKIPVEEADHVRFLVEIENDEGQMEYIDDARLKDIGLSGLGMATKTRLSIGQELRLSIHFKKIHLDMSANVIRSFTSTVEDDVISYGLQVEEEDDLRRLVEQFIYSFSPDRLKDCLVQMTLSDRYSSDVEGFEMFSLLISLYKDMVHFGGKTEFIETMLQEVVRILDAQRGTLLVINPDKNELEAVTAVGMDKKLVHFDYRKGIAGSVFTTGIGLNIDVVHDTLRFSPELDELIGQKTLSLICYPIYNREDKIIGVVEIVNKRNEDRFTIDDEKIMKMVALVFSSIYYNYNPMSELSKVRRFSTPSDREFVMVGRCKETINLRGSIVRLKDIEAPVYIFGEPGVGKGLFARILHHEGKRAGNLFMEIHCGGQDIKTLDQVLFGNQEGKGALEKCIGGTILFHEIQFLPLPLQSKLVQIVKERKIPGGQVTLDFRFVASSTKNIEKLVQDGLFNKELFEYLNKAFVYIDPLRKRTDDIKDLIQHFLKIECKKQGLLLKVFSPAVMNSFLEYDWPGNVRELRSCVEKAVLYNPKSHVINNLNSSGGPLFDTNRSPLKMFEDIPFANDPSIVLKDRLALIERQMILAEIKRHQGNKSKAAREMGISREALRKKLMLSQDILDALEGYKVQKKAA